MFEIKFFNLDWKAALWRFYLLMFVVIFGVLTKLWAISFLGLPVFISVMLGMSFTYKSNKKETGKVLKLVEEKYQNRKAV